MCEIFKFLLLVLNIRIFYLNFFLSSLNCFFSSFLAFLPKQKLKLSTKGTLMLTCSDVRSPLVLVLVWKFPWIVLSERFNCLANSKHCSLSVIVSSPLVGEDFQNLNPPNEDCFSDFCWELSAGSSLSLQPVSAGGLKKINNRFYNIYKFWNLYRKP